MFDVNKCLGDAEEQMELAIIHLLRNMPIFVPVRLMCD